MATKPEDEDKNWWQKFLEWAFGGEMINPLAANQPPMPTPRPTATPMPTPTPTPMQYGRSGKAQTIRTNNPSLYESALGKITNVGANDLEKNLLIDIAAAENGLKEQGNNYAWPQSTAQGMFMFNDPTWQDYLKASESARLRNADKLNAMEQAQAALFEIRNKRLGRWNASKPVWGDYYRPEELQQYYR